MKKEEIIAKIDKLSDNQDFANALSNAGNISDIMSVLASYGINATEDDLNDILSAVKPNDELDEDALEDVSGGIIITATSLALAAGVLGISVALYVLWKRWGRVR